MAASVVSTKGWVVIPREYREKYGLTPGTKVHFVDYGGVLSIVPIPADAVAGGFGVLLRFGGEESWTQAYRQEKSQDREREERIA